MGNIVEGFIIRDMIWEDIPEVAKGEARGHMDSWTVGNFRDELKVREERPGERVLLVAVCGHGPERTASGGANNHDIHGTASGGANNHDIHGTASGGANNHNIHGTAPGRAGNGTEPLKSETPDGPAPGAIAGHICLMVIAGEATVNSITVYPGYRKKGIGRSLLKAAMERAAALGALEYTLEVREENSSAIALYESEGFVREGLRRNYYTNPSESAVIYWKR